MKTFCGMWSVPTTRRLQQQSLATLELTLGLYQRGTSGQVEWVHSVDCSLCQQVHTRHSVRGHNTSTSVGRDWNEPNTIYDVYREVLVTEMHFESHFNGMTGTETRALLVVGPSHGKL